MNTIIECVPNFSEGRDAEIIQAIADSIRSVNGVKLLNIDPGRATNRTVMTFVGAPEPVCEAAFRAIARASELIDMRNHEGEHPRMGATDVCPLIPVSGISMQETAEWAKKLGQRVGESLNIPVYLYEEAQPNKDRSNLSVIRAGEYEGLEDKMNRPGWQPDYGPQTFNEKSGATVIGARDFLIAYNVNLNTRSVRRANSVAFDVREAGRVKLDDKGKKMLNPDGSEIRIPGSLKGVKAIGWYIEEYGLAQVSINITRYRETPLHQVFEECAGSALRRGLRVTGSELVGMVPLNTMLEAGRYFLKKQGLSSGQSDEELIHIAVKSMGLDELAPFSPQERIIEYQLHDDHHRKLVRMSLESFSAETAAESPAPGGGSVAAYSGALGISLSAMVANLSATKKGWEEKQAFFSDLAEQAQELRKKLLWLVDEDTRAFNAIMDALKLPKSTEEEKKFRKECIDRSTRRAIEVPLEVMKVSYAALLHLSEMATHGNPNSVSDAGVGALCARAAVRGAGLNVRINLPGIKEEDWKEGILRECQSIELESELEEKKILAKVMEVMGYSK